MISILCYLSAACCTYALLRMWRNPSNYMPPWYLGILLLAVAGADALLAHFAHLGTGSTPKVVRWFFSSEMLSDLLFDVRTGAIPAKLAFWGFVAIAYLVPPAYELSRRVSGSAS